jgi:hypothetical protein
LIEANVAQLAEQRIRNPKPLHAFDPDKHCMKRMFNNLQKFDV